MLKKTVSYVDFNGQERTEDFYFNLSKADLVEMNLRENLSGGLRAHLEAVIASNDGGKIMDAFRDVIIKSYGIKSEDGREFRKSESISSGFMGSEAYSEIFLELVMNPEAASLFISAIVPTDFEQFAQKVQDAQGRPQPKDHLQAQPVTRNVPSFPTVVPPSRTDVDLGIAKEELASFTQPKQDSVAEQNAPYIPRPQHENSEPSMTYEQWVASQKDVGPQA